MDVVQLRKLVWTTVYLRNHWPMLYTWCETGVILLFIIISKFVVSDGDMKGPPLDHENWFVHSGRSIVAHVVAAPSVGKLFIRLETKFPENEDSVTPHCVDAPHDDLFANVFQSVVPPLGKFIIRLESTFSEIVDNLTPPFVDAAHDDLFANVVQSAIPPQGKFVIYD